MERVMMTKDEAGFYNRVHTHTHTHTHHDLLKVCCSKTAAREVILNPTSSPILARLRVDFM
jgi:hypothetical protein